MLCSKFEVDISKTELSVKFCLGVLPSFSTRWPSNPISDHIRTPPFPYMVWGIWNMFFPTFLNIYDIDITFRSINGSMAVFDFNSTSKKTHKRHETRTLYVIVHAASKIENILFFLYIRNTFRPFFSKNRIMLSFEHLTWTWLDIFTDISWFYICITISK